MLTQVSQSAVLAFGAAVCLLSVWGIVAPGRLMNFVYSAIEQDWGIHLAVILRLVLGAALIIAAPASRWPVFFEVLGWIAIAAAVALLVMGHARLRRLVEWFKRMPLALIRTWLLFGVAFGVLLVYGML